MVAYFCHHLSDLYVDLPDIYVDLLDLYVDLSENNHHDLELGFLLLIRVNASNCNLTETFTEHLLFSKSM